MRCKNCGCENDDNVYICQNCGSPLYDEDEIPGGDNSDSTRMFTPAAENPKSENSNSNDYDSYLDNFNNKTKEDLPDYSSDPYQNNRHKGPDKDDKEEKAKKKQIAIIIILVIVLIAIITGIIVAAANAKKKNNVTTAAPTVSVQTTEEETSEYTTRERTTTERTTESTTEETTTKKKTTTETTTETPSYEITVGTNDFGGADGGGTFKKGEKATVTCWPDDSSQTFLGWYKNGTKVSESRSYTFTVDKSAYLEARFENSKKNNSNNNNNTDNTDNTDNNDSDTDNGEE